VDDDETIVTESTGGPPAHGPDQARDPADDQSTGQDTEQDPDQEREQGQEQEQEQKQGQDWEQDHQDRIEGQKQSQGREREHEADDPLEPHTDEAGQPYADYKEPGGPTDTSPPDIGSDASESAEHGDQVPDPEFVAADDPADYDAEKLHEVEATEHSGPGYGDPGSPAPGATPAGAGPGGGGGNVLGGPGAPDDEEMPLAVHIEEMVSRLLVVLLAMAVVSAVVFVFAERFINFLWYSFLPGSFEQCPTVVPAGAENEIACPFVYQPLALLFARLKVASLVGFVAALPVMVYESYLFMRPGLYPRERRYYLASVPTSLLLALVGNVFAYFLVLPVLFQYFTGYTSQAALISFGLTETFNLIVMMLGFFALIFQIPLLIMLAIMMGVTSRQWLADMRLYFWGGFATVAFVFSPDPTGMAPILVLATMILLFEGTLLLVRWTDRSSAPMGEQLAARRPVWWVVAAIAGYAASSGPLPDSYYDQLPAAVTDALASAGLRGTAPFLIAGGLIVTFELLAYGLRRGGVGGTARRAIRRLRVVVWPTAVVVGYFSAPDPVVVEWLDGLALEPRFAVAVALGVAVLYEIPIQLGRLLRR